MVRPALVGVDQTRNQTRIQRGRGLELDLLFRSTFTASLSIEGAACILVPASKVERIYVDDHDRADFLKQGHQRAPRK